MNKTTQKVMEGMRLTIKQLDAKAHLFTMVSPYLAVGTQAILISFLFLCTPCSPHLNSHSSLQHT